MLPEAAVLKGEVASPSSQGYVPGFLDTSSTNLNAHFHIGSPDTPNHKYGLVVNSDSAVVPQPPAGLVMAQRVDPSDEQLLNLVSSYPAEILATQESVPVVPSAGCPLTSATLAQLEAEYVGDQPNGALAAARDTQNSALYSVVHSLPDLAEHRDHLIEPSQLAYVRKLGEGGFALVELFQYTPTKGEPMLAAVKTMKEALLDDRTEVEHFIREAALLRKLQHRSIVRYLGMGSLELGTKECLFLVTEFLDGGNLKELVKAQMSAKTQLYTETDALRWCIQTADGLRFLHTAKPAVVHRDLKLENLLVQGKDTSTAAVKISDFGLHALILKRKDKQFAQKPVQKKLQTHAAQQREWTANAANRAINLMVNLPSGEGKDFNLTGQTGSLMYMAPEVFRGKPYNEKADVFSFGCCMYELFHRYIMYSAVYKKGTTEEVQAYAEAVSQGYRPPLDTSHPSSVLKLIEQCWHADPNVRPTCSQLLRKLHEIERSKVLEHHAQQGRSNGLSKAIPASPKDAQQQQQKHLDSAEKVSSAIKDVNGSPVGNDEDGWPEKSPHLGDKPQCCIIS